MLLCTGAKQYKLSHGELQKHPNSLLATLASSVPSAEHQKVTLASSASSAGTTSANASRGDQSSASVTLDNLDLPICKIPIEKAAEWVVMCYKDDNIHPSALESLVNSCNPGLPSKGTDQLDKTIHTELSKLLDFFNLPGPVTKWLPPVQILNLSQSRLLTFSYTCYRLERAKRAVEDMLTYTPHKSEERPAHVAIYVVLRDRSNTAPMTSLAVRALRKIPQMLVSQILSSNPGLVATEPAVLVERPASGSMPATPRREDAIGGAVGLKFGTYDDSRSGLHDSMGSEATELLSEHPKPISGTQAANAFKNVPSQVYGSMKLRNMIQSHKEGLVVGPADPELGQPLQDALSSYVHGTRLSWGFAQINIMVRDNVQRPYSCAEIPVWVLTW